MDVHWPNFGSSLRNTTKKIKRKSSIFKKGSQDSIAQVPSTSEFPTPHLLCSNYPPTDEEIPLLLNTISQTEAKAQRLAGEVASNIRAPNRIQDDLERAKKVIAANKAILSPVRRLPAEILQEIIVLSTSLYPDNDAGAMGSGGRDPSFHRGLTCLPLVQSHVSRFWRDTAISCSELWSKLPPIPLDQPYTSTKPFLFFLDILLDQRCGKESLDFHIFSRSPEVVTAKHPIIARLVSRSAMWKRAVFELPSIHRALLCGAAGRLSALQSLVIVFPPPPRQMDHPTTISLFENAPRLRSVIFVRADTSQFLLPHHQLVHYRENECESTLFDDPSKSPSSLQTLEFKENPSLMIMLAPTHIAWMDKVTTLRMQLLFRDNECPMLDALVLPALKELAITARFPSERHANVIPPVHALISRSGTPSGIERLQIHSGYMVSWELNSLLRDTPLVTHLNVSLPPAEDIRQLAIIGGKDVLVPALQVCTFYVDDVLQQDVWPGNQNPAWLCHQMAVNRCDLPGNDRFLFNDDDNGDGDDNDYNERLLPEISVQRLCAFYLRYNTVYVTPPQRRVLQRWSENSVSSVLGDSIDRLSSRVWGAVRANDMKPSAVRAEVTTVLSILSVVEEMEIHRVEDIYVSGIHRILDAMVQLFNLLGEPRNTCGQSAEKILNKWKPLFEESFDNIHWGIYWNYLYYISKTNPLRASPDSMTRIVFDQYKPTDIAQADLPWPMTVMPMRDVNSAL